MKNKSIEMQASIKLVNDKLNFIGTVDDNDPISIDYIAPMGDNLGYTSLELFLLSLSSCIGTTALTFLRKMNKSITRCEIQAKGIRREEDPTGFKDIYVDIELDAVNTTKEDMEKVIYLAEDKCFPVYSMIKGNTNIEIGYTINKSFSIIIIN